MDSIELNNITNISVVLLSTLDIIYVTASFGMSLFSIIGSSLIILTYMIYFDLRGKSREIIVHMSLGDLMSSLGVVVGLIWFLMHNVGGSSADQLCQASSSLWIFASIATFLWNLVFAVYLYISIIWRNTQVAGKLVKITRILVWVIAVIVMLIAISFKVVGRSKASQNLVSWCWINDKIQNNILWCYITGKGWEFAVSILIVLIYINIFWNVTREMNREPFLSRSIIRQTVVAECKMLLIPLLFIICRIPGTIRFYMDINNPNLMDDPPLITAILVVMQGLGDSSQGAVNCVLYCFLTPRVKQKIPCCKNEPNDEFEPLLNS